jgi:hypothetical protein
MLFNWGTVMRSSICSAFLAFTVVAAYGADAKAQQTQAKQATGSIAGRVTVGDGPGRRLPVMLVPADGSIDSPAARTKTDDEGRFQMTGIPAGHYLIMPFAPARIPTGTQQSIPHGIPITISEGEAVDAGDIELRPCQRVADYEVRYAAVLDSPSAK